MQPVPAAARSRYRPFSPCGWLPHTVRGAIAGALKKKLGLQISSEMVEGRGRVYRIQT
jgi:hypothetical protein